MLLSRPRRHPQVRMCGVQSCAPKRQRVSARHAVPPSRPHSVVLDTMSYAPKSGVASRIAHHYFGSDWVQRIKLHSSSEWLAGSFTVSRSSHPTDTANDVRPQSTPPGRTRRGLPVRPLHLVLIQPTSLTHPSSRRLMSSAAAPQPEDAELPCCPEPYVSAQLHHTTPL